VEQLGARLTRIVAALTSIFDTRRVILAGRLSEHCGPLADIVARDLPGYLEAPHADVVVSTLGADVVAVGAVERALAHVREHALEIEPRRPAVPLDEPGEEQVPGAGVRG
jgi:hypothetical protein